jgi:hypothetical protein
VVDAPQAEGLSVGFSGAPVPDRIEDEIKRARRDQLALANDRAREDAAARAGRYLLAEDSRQQGRMAAAMVATFEGAPPEFAMALAAKSNLSSRDTLHVLREAWRIIRARASEADAKAAAALPADRGCATAMTIMLANPERLALRNATLTWCSPGNGKTPAASNSASNSPRSTATPGLKTCGASRAGMYPAS